MTWGVVHLAMLGGLAGVAIPVAIHLLSRRDEPVVDWAAMRFLELAPSQRRRIRFADALLMLARMLPLALVALALARPYWKPSDPSEGANFSSTDGHRSVVLILDGTSGMGPIQESSAHTGAVRWARRFVGGLQAGDSVAVLRAGDRVRPLVDPASFDLSAVDQVLAKAPEPRGNGDLAAAMAEAIRLLGRSPTTSGEVIVLTDGQRGAWRLDEPARWTLLRDLRKRMASSLRIWVASFPPESRDQTVPDGSVGPLTLSRATVPPGLSVEASATVANAGPGEMTRVVELFVDDQPVPGASQVVGPLRPGAQTPVQFSTQFEALGDHLVSIRLAAGADPRPDDDASAQVIQAIRPPRVLLVDGSPGVAATAFLRIALAPRDDRSPQFAVTTKAPREVLPESLEQYDVVVLAAATTLPSDLGPALGRFVANGGGLLLVPGPKANVESWERVLGRELLPAHFDPVRGDPDRREVVARPGPASFVGPALSPLGRGDAPALGTATLFAFRPLMPFASATILARMDRGDPWVVGRSRGQGQVVLVATALDASAGTLVANPDFVPWVHRVVASLARESQNTGSVAPGSDLRFDLDAVPNRGELSLTLPSGASVAVPVIRSGASSRVIYQAAEEAGVYRLAAPDRIHYAVVAAEPRTTDRGPLTEKDRQSLAQGWPLQFLSEQSGTGPKNPEASGPGGQREAAPYLILAVLVGLCLEVVMTRRLARAGGRTE